MGFLIRFFAITVAVLFGRGAYAQCCWCDADDGCQLGYSADWYDPYTGQPWCGPCGGNCDYCNETLCSGYTLTCPSDDGSPAWTTIKCKVVADNCNGVSGCTRYEACNSATGNVWPDLSSNCHLENGTCYVNTRNCKDFTNHTENNSLGCPKSSQQGQAQWKSDRNAWDTKGCYCNLLHLVLGNEMLGIPVWCDDLNAEYIVSDANRYVTTRVSADIVYTMERLFCAKCHPGYLPTISQSPETNGIYSRPDNNGTWGVAMCSDQVTMPYYADGCVIDFGLSSGSAAVSACQMSCPGGMTITEDGATGISQCVPTGLVYEDATGTFVIGSDLCH